MGVLTDEQKKKIDDEIRSETAILFCERHGITGDFLARELKRLLKAKVAKQLKLKGAVSQDNLPRGRSLIATSGIISHGKEGDDYGDGDSLIEWQEIDNGTRLRALDIACKLRGDYPDGKLTLSGDIYVNTGIKREGDDG